jgi:hypothetical protein
LKAQQTGMIQRLEENRTSDFWGNTNGSNSNNKKGVKITPSKIYLSFLLLTLIRMPNAASYCFMMVILAS